MLNFKGKRLSFDDVPMEIEPLQKPHPPIWYGVHSPDSAERAGAQQAQRHQPRPPKETRLSIDRYRSIWPQVHGHAVPFPKLGLGRFIVVAPTDAEAMALARRAYLLWHESFTHLFRRHERVAVASPPRDLRPGGRTRPGRRRLAGTVAKFLSASSSTKPAATTWWASSPSAI